VLAASSGLSVCWWLSIVLPCARFNTRVSRYIYLALAYRYRRSYGSRSFFQLVKLLYDRRPGEHPSDELKAVLVSRAYGGDSRGGAQAARDAVQPPQRDVLDLFQFLVASAIPRVPVSDVVRSNLRDAHDEALSAHARHLLLVGNGPACLWLVHDICRKLGGDEPRRPLVLLGSLFKRDQTNQASAFPCLPVPHN
jgi:hypothetical protein